MGLFKKGNPITEKQMQILENVVNSVGSRGEHYEYKPYVVKMCKKVLKKPKKYTSKDVAPIINEIFQSQRYMNNKDWLTFT